MRLKLLIVAIAASVFATLAQPDVGCAQTGAGATLRSQEERQPSAKVQEIPPMHGQPVPQQPDSTLILPPQWKPTVDQPMPPVPEPLAEIKIPDVLRGCWKGTVHGFDEVYPIAANAFQAGEPGEIVFCFREGSIEVPHADVVVPFAKRVIEVPLTLGLGYTSFKARGIRTVVYRVDPTMIRGRTDVDVDPTFHLLYAIPIAVSPQPSKLDWKGTLIAPGKIRLEAYEVHWAFGKPSFGATWHADFELIGDTPDG